MEQAWCANNDVVNLLATSIPQLCCFIIGGICTHNMKVKKEKKKKCKLWWDLFRFTFILYISVWFSYCNSVSYSNVKYFNSYIYPFEDESSGLFLFFLGKANLVSYASTFIMFKFILISWNVSDFPSVLWWSFSCNWILKYLSSLHVRLD